MFGFLWIYCKRNKRTLILIFSSKFFTVSHSTKCCFKHNYNFSFQASDLRVRLASPSQLQPKPEVDDLVFGKFFTDHMLKILWHKSLGGWQKPEITPMENLVIHPAAKVLHYAVEVS